MAGDRHQFILGLVIKKMREDGATISCVDGTYPGLFGEACPVPPTIIRHRPDAMGVMKNGQICIGEAKTENDIMNTRTFEQLRDFANLELNGMKCDVYIGVPKSAEKTILTGLEKVGLHLSTNITILYVPDEIIND